MIELDKIRQCLGNEKVDGWLFYNFHNIDPSANAILHVPAEKMLSRRWFYLVPTTGEPVKLVHRIESGALDHLPGQKIQYSTWLQMHNALKQVLQPLTKVCMQYSPMNAIPYVSYVDAGTVELVRSTGVEVCSSANLIQRFEAVWSPYGLQTHQQAAAKLREIVHLAFSHVKKSFEQSDTISEYQLQQFILEQFSLAGMVCSHPPIVAVNEHSGDPHFETQEQNRRVLRQGDLLLIDLWAKLDNVEAVYADITWMAVVDSQVGPEYAQIFDVLVQARDAAVKFIQKSFAEQRPVFGYQVDDACRQVIDAAGYAEYFIHRTGHSIGSEVHWKGVNMDNFETRDERKLIDGIGFSIEPGIYLQKFGMRSELNMYIDSGQAYISGQPVQKQLIPLLASDWPA